MNANNWTAEKMDRLLNEPTSAIYFMGAKVDAENNAETWWNAVREAYPSIAKALTDHGHAVIAVDIWDKLAALPGFEDGPEYAPTALIDCSNTGDQWADIVGTTHRVFEIAE